MGSQSGQLKIDNHLTNLATAFPIGNKIGKRMSPVVSVDNMSDYIFVDADDAITQHDDLAEGVASNEVDFESGTPYQYRTLRYALRGTVLDKQADNAAKVVRLKQKVNAKLTNRLLLKHELRVANILTDNTLVTQYNDLNAVLGTRWDEANPDLEANIITAVRAIYDETGRPANTIMMPFSAALYAANMDFIKDTLQYLYGMEVITATFQEQVMRLVGLPPVIKGLNLVISNARMDTSAKGLDKTIANPWGNNCLIGYVPPVVPFIDDDFGLITTEYKKFATFSKRISDPFGEEIVVDWDYEVTQGNLACWYLIENVIA